MASVILIAVFFIFLDRYLKYLAIDREYARLLGDILKFNFAANPNIAFSLPLGGSLLNFIIMAAIVSLGYFFYYCVKKEAFYEAMSVVFIILGAISNLADRAAYGFVIDYFDLKYFTVFNLADMMIVGGTAWLLFLSLEIKK